jgi:hypothetical protein
VWVPDDGPLGIDRGRAEVEAAVARARERPGLADGNPCNLYRLLAGPWTRSSASGLYYIPIPFESRTAPLTRC